MVRTVWDVLAIRYVLAQPIPVMLTFSTDPSFCPLKTHLPSPNASRHPGLVGVVQPVRGGLRAAPPPQVSDRRWLVGCESGFVHWGGGGHSGFGSKSVSVSARRRPFLPGPMPRYPTPALI